MVVSGCISMCYVGWWFGMGVCWNVGMEEKGYVGAYMFMVSVVYVSGRVLCDGVVSVSIHFGGENGLGVEGLGGAYVVWSTI